MALEKPEEQAAAHDSGRIVAEHSALISDDGVFMNIGQDPTGDRLAHAQDRLRHPRPGTRIEAARKFGVDLTLLIEKLRVSPAERVRRADVNYRFVI